MCLSFLLLECLDRLQANTPKMISYKESLVGLIEEMSSSISDTNAIQKTTYFQELQNKVLTTVRKHFDNV